MWTSAHLERTLQFAPAPHKSMVYHPWTTGPAGLRVNQGFAANSTIAADYGIYWSKTYPGKHTPPTGEDCSELYCHKSTWNGAFQGCAGAWLVPGAHPTDLTVGGPPIQNGWTTDSPPCGCAMEGGDKIDGCTTQMESPKTAASTSCCNWQGQVGSGGDVAGPLYTASPYGSAGWDGTDKLSDLCPAIGSCMGYGGRRCAGVGLGANGTCCWGTAVGSAGCASCQMKPCGWSVNKDEC